MPHTPVFPVPASALLAASAALSLCCMVAAIAMLRYLGSIEARLRAVEPRAAGVQRSGIRAAGEQFIERVTPKSYQVALQRRLERAGLADRTTAPSVLFLVTVAALVLTIPVLGVGGPSVALLAFPAIITLALLLTGIWLGRRAGARRAAVQRSLAATLDLLVLAMEAGLSLDAAIREVIAEWQSPASRELEQVVLLSQLGVNRATALLNVAESLDLESLRRLAGRVSAAERLGSSLVLIMRAEAEEARRERRAIASRKVAQAPTKILIPSALLVLPVTLIVLLGPAIPQMMQMASGN